MFIFAKFFESDFLLQLLLFFCAACFLLAAVLPSLFNDPLQQRLKSIMAREGLRNHDQIYGARTRFLRTDQRSLIKSFVMRLKLKHWLGIEQAGLKLAAAGYRGANAESTFIFFRAFVPVGFFLFGAFYLFWMNDFGYSALARMAALIGFLYLGMKAPEFYLDYVTRQRREGIRRAFPDALDLLLICVEAGISIEQALHRVAGEIGQESVALAEELTLTAAELSFLPERRMAFENLARRVDVDVVRQIVTVLNQAERYGTPMAQALRSVAQESRDMRMAEAERKAAALPPKLTVPMIIFFLPALFVVILGPVASQTLKAFF